uniref:YHS domain-containing protein n=1 Tax=Desulfobacca acetoxidans TaxID=60893 RepID=A0A7C5ENU9_9BACT
MERMMWGLAALSLAFLLAGPLAAQGQSQTVCPVLGGKVDKKIYVDYQGYRVYFCCPGCDAEFRKDPEKYLRKMREQGITPEKSPAGSGKTGK